MLELYPGRSVFVCDYETIGRGLLAHVISEGVVPANSIVYVHGLIVQHYMKLAQEGKALALAALEGLRKAVAEASRRGVQVMVTSAKVTGEADTVKLNEATLELAKEHEAVLITPSGVLATVAEAMGLKVLKVDVTGRARLKLEEFFGENVMSVHLVEGAPPLAKKGRPGEWQLVTLRDKPLTQEEIEAIVEEIISEAKSRRDAYIEADRTGSTMVQLGQYRVIIARSPLSSRWEVTAVRPLVKLRLSDYNLPEKLLRRLDEKAEGILIAGAPGMGKTTFAQALAEYYAGKGKVVKTLESPRDMRLPPTVVQYSKFLAEKGELHDVLLLSRPDYTVFDELRTDEDFRLYVDLRLAGIGMIGVLHATSPIDAVQRFLGRVELGVIPSVIDTVIFIDKGRVSKVYEIGITVKLPRGLKEEELTRPVVEVRDFLTGRLEYEIYTFGEQTVVVPVWHEEAAARPNKLKERLEALIPGCKVEFVGIGTVLVRVPREASRLVVKKAGRIRKLAEKYGYDVKFETG